jgi:CBS domain containing-hemolysin-like protein
MQVRPIRLSDGRLRLPGSMRMDQAAPLVGNRWRGTDETVGAFVATVLGRSPESGDELMIAGTPVEIEAVEGGTIAAVIVGARADAQPEKTR